MASKKPTDNAPAVEEPEELLEAAEDEEEGGDYGAASGSDYAAAEGDDEESPVVGDDHLVDYSVKSRETTRATINSQIEEFLARGGRISTVEPNVTTDPPKKPTSNYGSRPI